MANKYIRHGETYCGDGTTSAAATSNGGVGAWNNINVLEGTAPAYGALAAGDTVYIRSKDNAGVNITRTLATYTTLGSASATSGSWVTWVIDGGTIWSGINGIVKYSCGSAYEITLRDYNRYVCEAQDSLEIYEANSAPGDKTLVNLPPFGSLEKAYINMSFGTTSYGSKITTGASGNYTLVSPHISSNKRTGWLIRASDLTKLTIINPDIELLNATVTDPVFYLGRYGSKIEVIGGQVRGVGATTGVALCSVTWSADVVDSIVLSGLQYPKSMSLVAALPGGANVTARVESFGNDSGGGATLAENWGIAVSRSDLNHPALNAYLPDGVTTKWSWKLYPSACGRTKPLRMVSSRFYQDTAATKTITLELLIGNAFSAINRESLWIDVSYIDNATGLTKSINTRLNDSSVALDTSTPTWTIEPPSWGSTTLVKRKLSVTTPTSIKTGSIITVILRGVAQSSSADDLIFFCPDFILS